MADVVGQEAVPGTVVSWSEGIGDERRYHVAHVSPQGITLVLKMKDEAQQKTLVALATAQPQEAAALLGKVPGSLHFAPDQISKVTYAERLWQLAIFDRNPKKTKIPEGKEQAELFAAIKRHLGGVEQEEEVDVWSVVQSPLFVLTVIGVIGGFFIWFTTICEPGYEATGRKAGMKNLMNWVGYKIGPVWMSVIVGSLAAISLSTMIYNLVRRPTRQVLEYGA